MTNSNTLTMAMDVLSGDYVHPDALVEFQYPDRSDDEIAVRYVAVWPDGDVRDLTFYEDSSIHVLGEDIMIREWKALYPGEPARVGAVIGRPSSHSCGCEYADQVWQLHHEPWLERDHGEWSVESWLTCSHCDRSFGPRIYSIDAGEDFEDRIAEAARTAAENWKQRQDDLQAGMIAELREAMNSGVPTGDDAHPGAYLDVDTWVCWRLDESEDNEIVWLTEDDLT